MGPIRGPASSGAGPSASGDGIPRTPRGKRAHGSPRRSLRTDTFGRPPKRAPSGTREGGLFRATRTERPPTLRGRGPGQPLRRQCRQRQGLRARPVVESAFGRMRGRVLPAEVRLRGLPLPPGSGNGAASTSVGTAPSARSPDRRPGMRLRAPARSSLVRMLVASRGCQRRPMPSGIGWVRAGASSDAPETAAYGIGPRLRAGSAGAGLARNPMESSIPGWILPKEAYPCLEPAPRTPVRRIGKGRGGDPGRRLWMRWLVRRDRLRPNPTERVPAATETHALGRGRKRLRP
jgi:hypothetical protein